MEAKTFRILFNKVAQAFGFTLAFGGHFKEMTESVAVLVLQRSNFGNYFELNIKLFFNGLFDETPSVDKNLILKENGHVFLRPPKEYSALFNFSGEPDETELSQELAKLFEQFIMPILSEGGSKSGMLKLAEEGKVFLLPAVKAELKK